MFPEIRKFFARLLLFLAFLLVQTRTVNHFSESKCLLYFALELNIPIFSLFIDFMNIDLLVPCIRLFSNRFIHFVSLGCLVVIFL